MTTPTDTAEDLRHHFTALADQAVPGPDCPEPERLYAAVAGQLDPATVGPLVDHTAICPSCALAWRLAREVAVVAPTELTSEVPVVPPRAVPRPPASAPSEPARKPRAPWYRTFPAAVALPAAAAVAAAVGLLVFFQPEPEVGPQPAPTTRSPVRNPVVGSEQGGETRSLLPPDGSLPRAAPVLRWTGPAEARYSVYLYDSAMGRLHVEPDLGEPRFEIPPSVMAGLAPGTNLIWRVETHLPDGTSSGSPSFVAVLE